MGSLVSAALGCWGGVPKTPAKGRRCLWRLFWERKAEYHSLACTQGFQIAAFPEICQQHCHHVVILRLQS